ncbi:MAG: hypothetical protein IJ648_08215, partial [Lachnospiraceae bacterium]|nr:hypothetical protein [Lachnospiraceae bacterium]
MTGSTYIIDGHINKEFYDSDDAHTETDRIYQYWEECKPIAFQMIKGRQIPLGIKIVFMLAPENIEKFLEQNNLPYTLEQVKGLYLNIRYEYNKLHISSGTILSVFTLDKTLDRAWEDTLTSFFTGHDITIENE